TRALHADDRARVLEEWRSAAAAGRAVSSEYRFQSPDGRVTWLSCSATPLHDETGALTGHVGTITDISARKRVEAELEKERCFLEATLESLEAAVIACDEGGDLTVFNRAARVFHGAGPYTLYHADGQTPMTAAETPVARARSGERVQELELVLAPQGGRRRRFVATGRPLRAPDGRGLGAVVALHDVTERQLAEDELRRQRDYAAGLVSSMQDGLLVLSPEGEVIEVSPSFCAMTGFSREELIGTCAPYPHWPEGRREGLERAFERLALSGRGEWDLEFKRSDGTRFPVIVCASVLRDADGR